MSPAEALGLFLAAVVIFALLLGWVVNRVHGSSDGSAHLKANLEAERRRRVAAEEAVIAMFTAADEYSELDHILAAQVKDLYRTYLSDTKELR